MLRRGTFIVLPIAIAALIAGEAWLPSGGAFALLRHPIATFRLLRAAAPQQIAIPVRGVSGTCSPTPGVPRAPVGANEGIDIFAPRGT